MNERIACGQVSQDGEIEVHCGPPSYSGRMPERLHNRNLPRIPTGASDAETEAIVQAFYQRERDWQDKARAIRRECDLNRARRDVEDYFTYRRLQGT